MEADLPRPDQGPHPKKAKTGERKDRDSRKAGPSSGRSQHYTPLNAPLDQVLMQIKDDQSLKWPEKMKGDPNKHNKNKYYNFHRDHGHDTDDCYDLKQQIENLIRQGKLRHFVGRDHKDEKLKVKVEESSQPLGEIRVIIGGTSTGQSSKSRRRTLRWCKTSNYLDDHQGQVEWTSQLLRSRTRMQEESTTHMTMQSSSLYSL